MPKLIAPDEIRVGFNKRSDTLTNMLGFMIYRNKPDGNYGFEKSFTGWKNKDIPEKLIGNKFQSGFVINKGQKRFHSYGGNVKIRVYHPEGFEFEIPLDNLAVLLHNCTLEKSTIVEKCIVAWDGSNVNLIPEVLKNDVEVKEIKKLEEKLSQRKYIPAGSCKKFEFYETENGVEFNLGKLPSYTLTKDKDSNVLIFNKERSVQTSLPISYFDNNKGLKNSTVQCIVGSKKLKEVQVDSELQALINKHKEVITSSSPIHYGHTKSKESEIFLRYCDERFAVLSGENQVPDEIEGDLIQNICSFVEKRKVSSLISHALADSGLAFMPQKMMLGGKNYYYGLSSKNLFGYRGGNFSYDEARYISGDPYDRERLKKVMTEYGLHSYDMQNVEIHGYLMEADFFQDKNNLISWSKLIHLPSLYIFDPRGGHSKSFKELNKIEIVEYFERLMKNTK